jgi:hypothetical protein
VIKSAAAQSHVFAIAIESWRWPHQRWMPDTSLPFCLYDWDENACDLNAASALAAAAAAAARVHQCDSLLFRAVVFGLGLGRHAGYSGLKSTTGCSAG